MRAFQPYPSGQAGWDVLRAAGQQFLSEHWQDGQCSACCDVPLVPEPADGSKPYPISHRLSRHRRRR